MRCKCGKMESWTTMGSPACRGCDNCGTTLAEGPDGHREPEAHYIAWEWRIGPDGTRWIETYCVRCLGVRQAHRDEADIAGIVTMPGNLTPAPEDSRA